MSIKKNRLLCLIMAIAMLVALVPSMAFGLEPVEPAYAYIPNMGDASVSKVDLTAETPLVVARYFTAPRLDASGDWGDLFGSAAGDLTAIAPVGWRTSRLAIDPAGNAWALNTGADSGVATVQGSVARIQFDVSGLTTTSTSAGDIKLFGTDEAVTVFPIGDRGDCPRSINVTADGRIFIGFHKAYEKWGYFQEYSFDGTDLTPIGPRIYGLGVSDELGDPPPAFDIAPYNATIDVNGTLWFVSYGSSRVNRNGGTFGSNNGIYSFNIDDPLNTFERHLESSPTGEPMGYMKSGYGILVDDSDPENVIVYATIMDTAGGATPGFYIKDGDASFVKTLNHTADVYAPRGLAFDDNGVIWIANSGDNTVTRYDPSGNLTTQKFAGFGNTPVGIGKDPQGRMWVIARDSSRLIGFEPDDPATKILITSGFNLPYAYGDFAVHTPPTYCICGYKFDADTEEGLGNWTIELFKWNADLADEGDWEYVKSTTTSAIDGKYCFEGLLAGEYKVSEVLEDGWEQIYPIVNEHLVNLPDGASNCEAVSGQGIFYNFENAKLYEISGFKYRSGTEIGLGGWMITLEKWIDDAYVPVAVTATDINGAYSFTGLLAGDYRISETLKPGWTQTSPLNGVHEVTLPYEGDPLSYDFENEPDMVCYDDTIWAYGGVDGAYTDGPAAMVVENNTVEGNPSMNWGWTNQITGPGIYVFTLYRGAGQNNLDNGTPVGTLTVNFNGTQAAITYEVAEPYTLSEAHLWVGETMLPLVESTRKGVTTYKPTSAPGQLANLGFNPEISADGLTATITVEIDAPFWVAAHGVVDWCEMIPINETVYYHWGVGYPYGATPETYAVASVSPEGMMDVWWYRDGSIIPAGWYHDIYTIVATPGFTAFTVANLNEPVQMLHGIHYPGVDTTYYQRTAIDVSEVPAPNAMSILIP